MSDISSASGETDSQFEHIFPQQDEYFCAQNGQGIPSNGKNSQENLKSIGLSIQNQSSIPNAMIKPSTQGKESDSLQIESGSSFIDDDCSDLFDYEEESNKNPASNILPSNQLALSGRGIGQSIPSSCLRQSIQPLSYHGLKFQRAINEEIEDQEEDSYSQSFLDSSVNKGYYMQKESEQSEEASFSYTSGAASLINRKAMRTQNIKSNKGCEDNSKKLDNQQKSGYLSLSLNDRVKNPFRKYQDLANLIKSLRNFEWYETSAFQNKLLPSKYLNTQLASLNIYFIILKVKFLTSSSFWFMVCSEYFQKSLVYLREEEIVQDVRLKIDKLPLEIVNRTAKFNCGRMSSSSLGVQSYSNDDYPKVEDHKREENIRNQMLENNSQKGEILKYKGKSQLEDQIDKLLKKENVKEFIPIKLSYQNKYSYTFEDEVYIIQKRMFLLDSLKQMEILQDTSEEKKIEQMKNLDLDKLISFLTLQYQRQQKETQIGFEVLLRKMKKDFNDERRINSAQDIDFNDILVDLNTLNPIENEFIRLLESKQQTENSSSLTQIQKEQSSKSQGIALTSVAKQSDEALCKVCNEIDYTENDLIVFCSKCNISVHQKCYGIVVISQEDWVCDSCIAFGPSAKYLRCALCPKRGGAMKRSRMPIETSLFDSLNPSYHNYLKSLQTRIMAQKSTPTEIFDEKQWEEDKKKGIRGEEVISDEGQDMYFDFQIEESKRYNEEEVEKHDLCYTNHVWIHLTCALWIQECFFEERSSMNFIKGIENIDKKRFSLTCILCKQKKVGCCVQCAKGKCSASFHPECARRAGLTIEVRPLEKINHLIYCQRHTPLKLRRILEQKEKKNKEEIQKFCRSIERYNETYFNEYKARIKDKFPKPSKAIIRKALKDQEKEENEFMKTFSEILLGYDGEKNQEGAERGNLLNENQRSSHLKTQLNRHDDIWYLMEFKDYDPESLFKTYRKMIKNKKTQFKAIFNSVKKDKEKLMEEMAFKENRQQKKELNLYKKEKLKEEKEIIKQTKIRERGNEESRNDFEDLSTGLKKRKYVKHNYSKDGGLMQSKDEEYETLSKRIKHSNEQEQLSEEHKNPKIIRRENSDVEEEDYEDENGEDEEDEEDEDDEKEEEDEKQETLFCYCQKKYTEGEIMIGCSECEEWFHLQCIGYIGTKNDAEAFDFCCNECDKIEGKRAQNKEIYQKWFDPNKALYYSYKQKRQVIRIPFSTLQDYPQRETNNNNNSKGFHNNNNSSNNHFKNQNECSQIFSEILRTCINQNKILDQIKVEEGGGGGSEDKSSESEDTVEYKRITQAKLLSLNISLENVSTQFKLKRSPKGSVSILNN